MQNLRFSSSGPLLAGSAVGQLLQWNGTRWSPVVSPSSPGQVVAWNGSEWAASELPAPLPEALVFDGPKDNDTSNSTTYVGTASIVFEVPAGQTFRLQWSGFVTADTGLTAVEHRVRNTGAGTDVGGPVRREIANILENAMVAGFTYLVGPQASATYELQFRRHGVGTATAQDMCLQAHRVE